MPLVRGYDQFGSCALSFTTSVHLTKDWKPPPFHPDGHNYSIGPCNTRNGIDLMGLSDYQRAQYHDQLINAGYFIILDRAHNHVHNSLITLYAALRDPEKSPGHPLWNKEKYPLIPHQVGKDGLEYYTTGGPKK